MNKLSKIRFLYNNYDKKLKMLSFFIIGKTDTNFIKNGKIWKSQSKKHF